MNNTLKAAACCVITSILGAGIGVIDTVHHERTVVAQKNEICKASPHLEACVERAVAASNVRFFWGGKEYRNGQLVTASTAN